MALEIFKLYGSILVNNDAANDSIQNTTDKADGLGKKFLSGVATAAKWGAGIATAAAAGATAMFGMATKAAAATDNIDKMSQKIGISREAYQELDFACSQSGTSVDSLAAGVKSLTSAMDSANSGNASAIENFEKLGVAVTDANGNLRSQEDVLFDTLNALQGMENQTEKARLATELLGKSGTELMPMLNGATGSIDEMRQQAHDLGLVLGDEAIDAGVAFTDQMDQLTRSFQAVVTQVGVAVMPIVSEFADWVLAHMPEIQTIISAAFEVISAFVQATVDVFRDYLLPVLEALWNWIEPYIPKAIEFFGELADFIQEAWDSCLSGVFQGLIDILGGVWETFQSYMPQIQEFFSTMVEDLVDIWNNNLKPMLEAIQNFIENVLAPAFEAVFENCIVPIVDAAFKLIIDLWETSLKPILTGIIDFITGVFSGDWSKAWSGIVSILDGIFDGLISIAKAPINAIIGMVNKLIGGLNKLQLPDWIPGIGGMGINIPEIPMLYKGTDYFQPTKAWGNMALVGEQGPELVQLPTGAKVNTASETQQMMNGNGMTVNIYADTASPSEIARRFKNVQRQLAFDL